MPLYDFQCVKCQKVVEQIFNSNECPQYIDCACGSRAKKIITCAGVFTANQDAPWIRSVCEVISKDSKETHVVEMLKNPNRKNYHEWMKKEGLRPMGDNESIPKGPDKADIKQKTTKYMKEQYVKRNALGVGGV